MIGWTSAVAGPHRGQQVALAGAPLAGARGALLLAHGRGGSALDILDLGAAVAPPGFTLVAPQAAGGQWYPQRFLAPLAANEPWLTSALDLLAETVARLAEHGLAAEEIALAGFSQGACLALEFAARHPRRYAAVLGFTGGLIGPVVERARYRGDFAGMPVLLRAAERDPHVPAERVRETAALLAELGAEVELRFFPGAEHIVRLDELRAGRELLAGRRAGVPAQA